MKTTTDRVASTAAKWTLGVGLLAAILSPFAGAGLAAWSTGSAALASLGLGAAVPLAGAGMLGGFILGSMAAPVVAIGAVMAATVVGVATKVVGRTLGWMFTSEKSERPQPDMKHSTEIDPGANPAFGKSISGPFASQAKPANENVKPAPKPEVRKGFRFSF